MAQAIKVEIDEESFEETKQKMLELYQLADSISAKMENAPIKSAEVVKIEDGDVLAVMVKGLHSAESLERLKKSMADSFLPKTVKVVIINAEAIDLKVIRAE